MKAKIEEINVIAREGAVSFVVIKASATQGDANGSIFNEDGTVNFAVNMARRTTFVKTLFPTTEEQAQAWKIVAPTLATQPKWINLNYFKVPAPYPYNIVDKVTGAFMVDKDNNVRVFNEVSLVLFVDDNEQSLEGDPKDLALRAFERQVAAHVYVSAAPAAPAAPAV